MLTVAPFAGGLEPPAADRQHRPAPGRASRYERVGSAGDGRDYAHFPPQAEIDAGITQLERTYQRGKLGVLFRLWLSRSQWMPRAAASPSIVSFDSVSVGSTIKASSTTSGKYTVGGW